MTANLTASQVAERQRTHGLPSELDREAVSVPLATGHVRVIPVAGAKRFPAYLIEACRDGSEEPIAAKVVYSASILPRAVREMAAQVDPTIKVEPDPEPRAVVERLAALTFPTPARRR